MWDGMHVQLPLQNGLNIGDDAVATFVQSGVGGFDRRDWQSEALRKLSLRCNKLVGKGRTLPPPPWSTASPQHLSAVRGMMAHGRLGGPR